MATPTASSGNTQQPKLLRRTDLADTEGLLRETRATGLFYLPGPVLALFISAVLTLSVLPLRSSFPAFPFLTDLWNRFPTFGSSSPAAYLTIVFGLLTLLSLLWLLVRYLRWISTVYAVTTHRVIIQSGIFSRGFDEIPIPQVRGVDVHQSVGQRMLGYGTVRVSSEGVSQLGNEDWEGIPRPFEFQRLIEAANQAITSSVGLPPMRRGPG